MSTRRRSAHFARSARSRRRHSADGATSCRPRDGNHSPVSTRMELTNSYRPPGLEGIGCLPGRDQQDARFTSILKRKLVSLLETQINSCVREAAAVLARLGFLVAPIAPRGRASGGADQPSLADLSCEMGMRWRGAPCLQGVSCKISVTGGRWDDETG